MPSNFKVSLAVILAHISFTNQISIFSS